MLFLLSRKFHFKPDMIILVDQEKEWGKKEADGAQVRDKQAEEAIMLGTAHMEESHPRDVAWQTSFKDLRPVR